MEEAISYLLTIVDVGMSILAGIFIVFFGVLVCAFIIDAFWLIRRSGV